MGDEFEGDSKIEQSEVVVGAYPLGNHRALFDPLMRHYYKFVFGNIVVYGASDNTVYPPVHFTTTTITYTIGAAAPVVKQWEINLKDVVVQLKGACRDSEIEAVKVATWRNICEAFAEEAREFLKESEGELTTNLYDKWPRAFEVAPWIAFDFAGGLSMTKLSSGEKKVIEIMTKQLFRTQGQSAVF
ncbi:hypothetical protein TanjilG_11409 [Lupinus angustifolius]|uniref:Uncharacterized protein n=1 Tax=Lupinus angustifolius TaxID=3871 RepID=A0A1J7HMM9_LUPAN|nr:hypothetical protein TanjilG_11409 [Lupinus angustifolius]